MLQNDHNIDKKVRDSFSSWEVPPPPGAWARLERSVVDSRKTKLILLRRRMLSVAAVVLAFLAGYFIALNRSFENPDMPSGGRSSEMAANQHQSEGAGTELTSPTDMNQGASKALEPSMEQTGTKPMRLAENKPIRLAENKPIRLAENKPIQSAEKQQTSTDPLFSVSDLTQTTLADVYTPEEITVEIMESPVWPGFVSNFRFEKLPVLALADPIPLSPEFQRWSISGMAGQTYANYYQSSYGQKAEGVYEHSLMATTKDQMVNPLTSYSLDVNYSITPRVGISTGLAMYSFSTPMTSPEKSEFTLLSTDRKVGNSLGILELNKDIRNYLLKVPLLEVNSTQFEQRLSYVEIPLTANWNITDSRLGLGVRAGFGGNLLLDNSVYLKTEDYSSEIGTTAEIKDFYLSGIIAMDLSFRLHKRWKWNFSPVYRHALQPVSSSDYDPKIISFGLYTGILYRF